MNNLMPARVRVLLRELDRLRRELIATVTDEPMVASEISRLLTEADDLARTLRRSARVPDDAEIH